MIEVGWAHGLYLYRKPRRTMLAATTKMVTTVMSTVRMWKLP